MSKTYKALEKGFDNVKVRKPGETFTTDIPKGSWMVEVDADGNEVKSKSKPKADAEPGPLDGSVDELKAYLADVTSIEEIDKLIAGETGGKSRQGALAALDARRAEVAPA